MAKSPGRFALVFIFLTVMLNMIGLGVIMPVMPQLIMDVTGEGLDQAAKWGGYLTFVYALMQFIMMPIIGGLSDRFGRRPVLLASMAAYAFDFLVMAVAPIIGIIVVARLLAGAFAATFSTANAYIADITPPEKRAANFGLMGAAFGLGFIIGPGIGGLLGDQIGPRAPFYFVAALGAANFCFGLFALPETHSLENRRPFDWRRANAFGNFKQFRQYPVMLPIAGAIFLYQLAHWTFPSVWSYYAIEKFHWSASLIGASLMFVGLMAAIVQGGLTRIIIPKIGERAAAVAGFFIAAVTYVAFAYADAEWMVYALIAISSLAGVSGPALQGIMSRTIPPDAQGELQGAIAAIASLSMIVGPPLMTQTFAAFSAPGTPVAIAGITIFETGASLYFPGAPFILASVLTFLAFIPLAIAYRRIGRPRTQEVDA
jgi:MFS transporter, DHA1 family, tetracycline resistance protein